MKDIDKIRGCLIGGAVGDALGYAVEFLSLDRIRHRYGRFGIQEYELKTGVAHISDDTQMTLFTANGLLVRTTRGMVRGIASDPEDYCWGCYKAWLKTQEGSYHSWAKSVEDADKASPWLIRIPELHSARAPGNTVLNALRNNIQGTIEEPVNDSKGCGGLMRAAPVGLYFENENIDRVCMYGAKIAALTHGHPLGYIPAAAFVYIIHRLVYDTDKAPLESIIKNSIVKMEELFAETDYISEFVNIMQKAVDLAKSSMDDETAIKSLGEGWVAEETLAISVYCSLRYYYDFTKAVTASVNHSGDSDSTGSVTGNILGAIYGYDEIPERFREQLELKDVIMEIADDLFNDCQINDRMDYNDEQQRWYDKYIG